MKRIIFIAATLTFMTACKKEAPTTTVIKERQTVAEPQRSAPSTNKKLVLETFEYPGEIAGCSCYFAADRQQFVKQNYIYADDYQKKAFLKLDGKLMEFKIDEKAQNIESKTMKTSFENKDYHVEISGKVVEEGEIETSLYKGTITVKAADGRKTVQNFYGECGC